jgi:hypothetical protein
VARLEATFHPANLFAQRGLKGNGMTKSLYERLGGSSGIAALVDDIVEAHMANPRIKSRFLPIARSQAPGRSEEAHFLGMGSGDRTNTAAGACRARIAA